MSSISRLPKPVLDEYEWQFEGACSQADTSVFFSPEDERGRARAEREEAAKAYCAVCPVVKECLEHALKVREPFGVWGGLNASERAALSRTSTGSPRVRRAS